MLDPIFGDLDFTQQPVKAQPKLCLVNYLRARRLEAHLANPREQIEKAVAQCRHIGKPVQSPPLPPIAGQHDGFIAIKTQVGDNEYDNWNRNYCDLAKKLKPIDYDVVDGLLGEKRVDRPAIRKRVQRLFNGGQKLMDGESHILFFQFFSSAGLMEKNLNFQNFSTPL